jgi:hypothetical protein
MASAPAQAVQSSVGQFDIQDYDTVTSTWSWAQPPSDHHRLFLDVYNVTDFFDSETGGVAGFTDQTLLADTIRPMVTVLWDDRFRIQLGLIAEKAYGDPVGYKSVDPWIQLLWQPIQPLSVVFGNLDTPHYYLPALFYPTNYFMQETNEAGMQLILKKPFLYDDFYYNYRLMDTSAHNEKFDLGFVHRNNWKWLSLNYQSHWIHEGGQLNPHTFNTRNDVAQTFGVGLQFHPIHSLMIGGSYNRLNSHLRQDADGAAYQINSRTGTGHLFQAYARWGRVKLIFGDWRGHQFFHEGGDPMFTLPNMNLLTARWDILLSHDFNLFAETTGYFIGNNDLGYDRYIKAAFHIQAAWQFSVPIMEWTSPAASPEGEPLPARWDYGI